MTAKASSTTELMAKNHLEYLIDYIATESRGARPTPSRRMREIEAGRHARDGCICRVRMGPVTTLNLSYVLAVALPFVGVHMCDGSYAMLRYMRVAAYTVPVPFRLSTSVCEVICAGGS
jgi:hypothetical protein